VDLVGDLNPQNSAGLHSRFACGVALITIALILSFYCDQNRVGGSPDQAAAADRAVAPQVAETP
jgi:hypothetical protein